MNDFDNPSVHKYIKRQLQREPIHHVEYSPSFLRKEAEEQNKKFKTITLTQKQFIARSLLVVAAALVGVAVIVLGIKWVIAQVVRF